MGVAPEDKVHMAVVSLASILASAPSAAEVLAHPDRYEAWLKKAQEAVGALAMNWRTIEDYGELGLFDGGSAPHTEEDDG